MALASSKRSQSLVLLLASEVQVGLHTVHFQYKDRDLEVVCSDSVLIREDARYLRKWETQGCVCIVCATTIRQLLRLPPPCVCYEAPLLRQFDKRKVGAPVLPQLAVT